MRKALWHHLGSPWHFLWEMKRAFLGGEGSKTELKQEQAVKLIDEFLSEGRKVSIAEINKEAAERGISERTVRLARNSMGDKIASERQGKDWWIWFRE